MSQNNITYDDLSKLIFIVVLYPVYIYINLGDSISENFIDKSLFVYSKDHPVLCLLTQNNKLNTFFKRGCRLYPSYMLTHT